MGWQERTEQQVGAQGVADLRRWLAMARQPEPADLPQAHGLSILITVVAVVAALLLVPTTSAAAKPLPAGIYEVAVAGVSVTLSVGADGATAVAAPDGVVVHLEHDDDGRPLDQFTVEFDRLRHSVDLDVAEDGSYSARVEVEQRDGRRAPDGARTPDDARAPGGERGPGDERGRATNRGGAATTSTDPGAPTNGDIAEESGPSRDGERSPMGEERAADPATTGREAPPPATGRGGAGQSTARDPRAPASDEAPEARHEDDSAIVDDEQGRRDPDVPEPRTDDGTAPDEGRQNGDQQSRGSPPGSLPGPPLDETDVDGGGVAHESGRGRS